MLPWIWKYLERPVSDEWKSVSCYFWAKTERRIYSKMLLGIVIDVDCVKELKLYLNVKVIWIVILRRDVRVCFTQLRLSSHNVLVERARWLKVKVPYTQRTCTLRNSNDIEDEYHVTLVCEYFKDVRKKYIKPFYYQRPNMMIFFYLITSVNKKDRFRLMLFLKVVFKMYAEQYDA